MRDLRFRLLAVLIGFTLLPASAVLSSTADETEAASSTARYLRVIDEPDKFVSLEIASRTFVHDDEARPTVALVSVAHIADESFYNAIAKRLDEYELVLYEAVAPAGVRAASGSTREEKIDDTRRAMALMASLIEQYRAADGAYPSDIESLSAYVQSQEPIVRNWFHHALTDPWGQPLRYTRTDDAPGYELLSQGPPARGNEAKGGDRSPERDQIRFDGHATAQPMPREESNMQKQLAEALGLAYQLESLPYESSNWYISDMTAEELYRAFSGTEAQFDAFSGAMAGSTLPARLVGMMLRFVRMLDAMYDGAVSDMVKVLFIEILGDEQIVQASMEQMGGDFSKILIDKRNQVVIDDVAALFESRPNLGSIAILYGAAHMPDLAERLSEQLGYQQADGVWYQAITVDLTQSRVDQRQLTQMRTMIRRMMQPPGGRRR